MKKLLLIVFAFSFIGLNAMDGYILDHKEKDPIEFSKSKTDIIDANMVLNNELDYVYLSMETNDYSTPSWHDEATFLDVNQLDKLKLTNRSHLTLPRKLAGPSTSMYLYQDLLKETTQKCINGISKQKEDLITSKIREHIPDFNPNEILANKPYNFERVIEEKASGGKEEHYFLYRDDKKTRLITFVDSPIITTKDKNSIRMEIQQTFY